VTAPAQIRLTADRRRVRRSEGNVTLTPEQSKSLRAELDALRQEYVAKIGLADAQYIRAVRAVARTAHAAGRLLVHFSLEPVSWGAGVAALAAYKVLENMEIGHNVMHGQYDFMRDPSLCSATYEWDMVGTAKSWKRAHNATHHVFYVIGRDRDFGYNAFRFSDEVPWRPFHLLQPLASPLSGLFFEYSIGAYDLGLLDALGPKPSGASRPVRRPARDVARDVWDFARKATRKGIVEYVLYPALAGPFAAKVLAGNALANALRNGWAYAVIYCGHLTGRTATFSEEDVAGEDRGGWYARQVTGSSNFEASRIVHVLSGHLGFQIEHHLFPNVPAWRYPEMAPRVRAICERHGLPYATGSFASQLTSAMRRLLRFALPPRAARGAASIRRRIGSRAIARGAPAAARSTAADPRGSAAEMVASGTHASRAHGSATR
jgi:fatty acid desaturase